MLAQPGWSLRLGADEELPEIGRPFREGTRLAGGIEVQLCPAIDTLRAMPDTELKLLTQRYVWAHPRLNLQFVVIEGGAGGPLALQP